jgi:hypothetical protein
VDGFVNRFDFAVTDEQVAARFDVLRRINESAVFDEQ